VGLEKGVVGLDEDIDDGIADADHVKALGRAGQRDQGWGTAGAWTKRMGSGRG